MVNENNKEKRNGCHFSKKKIIFLGKEIDKEENRLSRCFSLAQVAKKEKGR